MALLAIGHTKDKWPNPLCKRGRYDLGMPRMKFKADHRAFGATVADIQTIRCLIISLDNE